MFKWDISMPWLEKVSRFELVALNEAKGDLRKTLLWTRIRDLVALNLTGDVVLYKVNNGKRSISRLQIVGTLWLVIIGQRGCSQWLVDCVLLCTHGTSSHTDGGTLCIYLLVISIVVWSI